ncbi:MAG: hypothetical protein WCS96_10740, partial [Victivallales bacterium]
RTLSAERDIPLRVCPSFRRQPPASETTSANVIGFMNTTTKFIDHLRITQLRRSDPSRLIFPAICRDERQLPKEPSCSVECPENKVPPSIRAIL